MRDWLFYKTRGIKQRLGLPLVDHVERFTALADDVDFGTSEIGRLFKEHKGRHAYKWVHYFDCYERHFARFRNTPVRMLEIGVSQGGSLQVWRDYFGPDAIIFGIDINPDCRERVEHPNQVRIGSQDDPELLRAIVKDMGGLDIVLDDGSHFAHHQRASFKTLFPLLGYGGTYAIEDIHTAYWPGDYAGGYRRPGTAIELAKQVVDDMHGWWHDKPSALVPKEDAAAVHFYDSIVFMEKAKRTQPQVIRLG